MYLHVIIYRYVLCDIIRLHVLNDCIMYIIYSVISSRAHPLFDSKMLENEFLFDVQVASKTTRFPLFFHATP